MTEPCSKPSKRVQHSGPVSNFSSISSSSNRFEGAVPVGSVRGSVRKGNSNSEPTSEEGGGEREDEYYILSSATMWRRSTAKTKPTAVSRISPP